MFTGLVEEIGVVLKNRQEKLTIQADFPGLKLGESLSVNGVCLTVVEFISAKRIFTVEVTTATLQKSNLGNLRQSDRVNLERALVIGERLGGHWVTGHIAGVGCLKGMVKQKEGRMLEISFPEAIGKSFVDEGSVAVDGVSLTVWKKEEKSFKAAVIPHTQKNTTLGEKKIGDLLNIEPDILIKYLEKIIEGKNKKQLDWKLLKESGFL
ncbi:MAG: riboflavin synthase [Elusimicrobiota bacterium]